jgi:hypothetical protein
MQTSISQHLEFTREEIIECLVEEGYKKSQLEKNFKEQEERLSLLR